MKRILFLLLIVFNGPIYGQGVQEFPVLKGEYLGQKLPGVVPEVFAPGIVSDTSWGEHCPLAISPKGDEVYWSAWTMEYPTEDGKDNTQQIFFSKLENGVWTKPALAEFVKNHLTSNNGVPVFSLDGSKLFFNSNRPGGLGETDVWYAERKNDGWSDPVDVGEPFNSDNIDWTPVFTESGNAYRMGNYFRNDNETPLCFKYSNGRFSDPTPVAIHPDFHPWYPMYVSPDESYLIFGGYHYLQTFGGFDLYISFRMPDGQWGYPVNMGGKINTDRIERFPVVSPDGKYLFFVRHTETQDLFWVSTAIFDDLKTECIEKTKNPPPAFKAVELSSEDLDKYLGVYSGDAAVGKLTISKEGSVLMLQFNKGRLIALECYGTDKFKYDRFMINIEFITKDKKLRSLVNGTIHELTKE